MPIERCQRKQGGLRNSPEDGYVFVHYASLPFNGASIIARITVDPKKPRSDDQGAAPETVKVLMNIPQPCYNRYGGMIAFGPDGKLHIYICRGDAGWEDDPLNAEQNLNVLRGKLLRIDVDTDAIADGKKLYTSNCIVCHGTAGTGKMGPTIVGKDVIYKQVLTNPGMFAIIQGGASGKMQSFRRRGMMKCSGSSSM